ncbi:MAG: hypothetical protein ACI3XR_02630 [Eubacteriales bacterium]
MAAYDRETCIRLLRDMQDRLEKQGEERYPRRSDFSEEQVVAIKAYLGPFPRALEAAGLKPPRSDERIGRTREKRIRSARARNAARREPGRAPSAGAEKEGADKPPKPL